MALAYRALAHSANTRGIRHPLVDHLQAVSEAAAGFATAFGAADAARLAGLWHDIGKFDPDFQRYLLDSEAGRGPAHGPDHKAAGARLAVESQADLLAFVIAGHHGGMHDRADLRAWLAERGQTPGVATALGAARAALDLHPVPLSIPPGATADRVSIELLTRLVFSSVVDGDFLDTEAHFDPDHAGLRRAGPPIEELWARASAAHDRLVAGGRRGGIVNAVRGEVYEACLAAAELPSGFFRLTVPTGGGKTLSGLAFALRHASRHGLRRVVVAVPFTSITEQTAAVYRDTLGNEALLEHHSAVDPGRTAGLDAASRIWLRLAAENWDVPVVVTTTVRLFESLFGNAPRATRRVHRLARSVIVLDEAQALPPHLLDVTLDMLTGLVRLAGASVVLCTATQPAFDPVTHPAVASAREIVPDHSRHFAALRRVRYETPARDGRWGWARVAAEMQTSRQALAIVNRRRDALHLLRLLPRETHHLSTLLCGAHRRRVLRRVRTKLAAGEPCRLVSTQVVEAGVDVDFPLVLRALAPFDSVVQAAGRCNREGRLDAGRCVVFLSEEEDILKKGAYRTGRDECLVMLREGTTDFDDPVACSTYFRRLYREVDTDDKQLRAARDHLRFATIAHEYQLIDEITEEVVVATYSGARRRVSTLLRFLDSDEERARSRAVLRRLQPYTVSLRRRDVERAEARGWVVRTRRGTATWTGPYDERTGVGALLTTEEEGHE
jgi:CRISPR-associated endonuclease/helicase Cas3